MKHLVLWWKEKKLDRKMYGFYGNELRGEIKERVYYVQCDCKHLAIRQNQPKEIFRCSICGEMYIINQFRLYTF